LNEREVVMERNREREKERERERERGKGKGKERERERDMGTQTCMEPPHTFHFASRGRKIKDCACRRSPVISVLLLTCLGSFASYRSSATLASAFGGIIERPYLSLGAKQTRQEVGEWHEEARPRPCRWGSDLQRGSLVCRCDLGCDTRAATRHHQLATRRRMNPKSTC
jgi:hypothetical protein